MSLRSLLLLVLVAAAGIARAGQAQEPIAKVKSAPQDYRDRQIQLEGEVVEIRGLSPRSGRGSYRLLDESDPVGLLVRTAKLPESGGPFKVRARLAPELLQDGVLLVDELSRSQTGGVLALLALLLGILGMLTGVVLAGLYYRARRAERRLRLGPPMWLIPSGVEDPKPETATESSTTPEDGGAPVPFNFRLHYIERERSVGLERQKRQLLLGLVGTAVVTVTGMGGYTLLQLAEANKPAFVLQAPSPLLAERPPAPPQPDQRADDTLRIGLMPSVAAPRPVVPDSARRPRRLRDSALVQADSTPRRNLAAIFRQDTARTGTQVVVVTQPARPSPTEPPPAAQVVLPPPAPANAAAPLEIRDTAPPAPRPDPAALRRAAAAELDAAIQRFVGALVRGQIDAVAGGLSATGNPRWRDRFLDFLRQNSPAVSLGGSDQPAVTESSAEASFTVEFRWRAQFGVERRKSGRFGATTRRSGDGWGGGEIRLLEAFP